MGMKARVRAVIVDDLAPGQWLYEGYADFPFASFARRYRVSSVAHQRTPSGSILVFVSLEDLPKDFGGGFYYAPGTKVWVRT